MDLLDFPVNDYINHILMDEDDEAALECSSRTKPTKAINSTLNLCEKHNQYKSLFCAKCMKEICGDCVKVLHIKHTIILLSNAVEKNRNAAMTLITEQELALEKINSAIEDAEKAYAQVGASSYWAVQKIETFTSRYMAQILRGRINLLIKMVCFRNRKRVLQNLDNLMNINYELKHTLEIILNRRPFSMTECPPINQQSLRNASYGQNTRLITELLNMGRVETIDSII